jgi:hypothetical protein
VKAAGIYGYHSALKAYVCGEVNRNYQKIFVSIFDEDL